MTMEVISSASSSTSKSPSRSNAAGGGGGTNSAGGNDQASSSSNGPTAAAPPVSVPGGSSSNTEDNKPAKWQFDLLMEKLRQKSAQLKPLSDTAKNIRQALMERRCILDQGEKQNLQKSLDSLQQNIKVNSLQSMVERLDMVARQLGLKFTPGATGHEWFISSDMFYLELLIDPNGVVEDVKIQHDGKTEQQCCPEIVESLKRTDFVDFTAHLEGLVSIYQLNADKKIKSKAYIALQALETDLSSMASTYSQVTDGESVVMKSLLGLLQQRKGGHPVKLVYYVSPYEFLDINSKSTLPNDAKTILSNKLGNVATVNIQASTSHKLQMSTTVNIMRTPDGKSIPRYGQLNATNSTALPACFMVNLGKAIPMCVDLLKTIQSITGIDCADFSNPQPILNLVSHHVSNGTLNCANNKGLFVALPDQVHCYFMTETPHLEGVMVSTISFTLASQLPQVIAILRQQLTFNTLVASCVRIESKPELDSLVFEVNALSHQNLSVSFQHPLDDSLVTLEFDLRDITHPHCRLHAVANATDIIPTLEEHACKVVQRSMSIPITLRAVIARWQSMKVKADPANPDFSVGVGGSNMNMDVSHLNDRTCGSESNERAQNSSQQNVMIPPGIVNYSNSINNASSTTTTQPPKSHTQTTPSYSISPVNYPQQPPQSPMDILSYINMNPFLSLSNQLSMTGSSSFPNLTPNMAIQMLASQMGQTTAPSPMLMGLLDQVGQSQKRRKRKNTTDTLPPQQQSNPQVPIRPNQSPSRQSSNQKSPIRRQSDSSDGSGVEKNAINILMSELGMDQLPDSRWNIDITPVSSSGENVDDADPLKNKSGNKKPGPKRSISLDSHSSEELSGIQSMMDNPDFKPLMTPSLSITPVSTTSSNVNSLLASIRPGIEIIPLPNPVTIPTSITVTPILPKLGGGSSSSSSNDKQENRQKKSKDRSGSGKRKLDGNDMTDSKPSKIPFMDSRGKMSPNIHMTKKPSSPTINNNSNSPNKPMVASQGKPSVSTLKSVSSSTSGSPKYSDASKPKLKKPNLKVVKNLSNLSIPPLKAISSDMSTTSQMIKQEPQGSKLDMSKGDPKLINQVQMASAAVTAALQQAAASLVANANAQKPAPLQKKGGLAAVIDKLKSVHSVPEMPGDKKELATTMSTKDYLKVSSAITNDVLQQKKALGATTGGSGGNQEYMIKGGQGLKLTINKTKLKDPTKSPKPGGLGLKSPSGIKKLVPGMKPLTALSAKLASVTKKSTTPTKELKDNMSLTKPNVQQKPKDSKPRMESEDLTKKLFLPGAVKSLESGMFASAPVFDPNKFQIPKKSRSIPNLGSSSSNTSDNITSSSSSSSNSNNNKSNNDSSSSSSSSTNKYQSSSERKEKISPTPTPIPMEVDAPAPELTAETSSTTSSSSITIRSEPPALIEVGLSITTKTTTVSVSPPPPVLAETTTQNSEPDSTTGFGGQQQVSEPTSKSELPGSSTSTAEAAPAEALNAADFASPESPTDPLNCGMNVSTPQNIPTTPLNSASSEESPKVIPSASVTPPPPIETPVAAPVPVVPAPAPVEEMDEDQLVIDDGQGDNSASSNNSNVFSDTKTVSENIASEPSDGSNAKVTEEKSKSPEMPPPPPPVEVASAPPATSPAPILPPVSPKPVASPLSASMVSIASVHIVHSPQPNSPALRSPLVSASPAASPYAIDDDLMDEALIGGSAK